MCFHNFLAFSIGVRKRLFNVIYTCLCVLALNRNTVFTGFPSGAVRSAVAGLTSNILMMFVFMRNYYFVHCRAFTGLDLYPANCNWKYARTFFTFVANDTATACRIYESVRNSKFANLIASLSGASPGATFVALSI
jgi:hypothetical protein